MKINKLNYFAEYEKLGKEHLTENFVKIHELILKQTNTGADWSKINANATLSQMAEKQFTHLEKLLEKIRGSAPAAKPKASPVKPPAAKPQLQPVQRQQPEKPRQKAEVVKPVPVKAVKASKVKYGTPVETVDPHLLILARYRRLHGKSVLKEKIAALARTLVKQIEARVLRRKSQFADTVDGMKEHLFRMLKTSKGVTVSVSIPEKVLAAIDKAINTEHKMKSVQLLNRYAGMAGRQTTLAKAKKLYNAMYSAISNEHVPESDRYFERVIEVMKNLKAFVENDDESAQLELLPAELSGILGCGCAPTSDELNGFDELPEEENEEPPVAEPFVGKKDVKPVNSLDFMKQRFHRYPIADPWVRVFGCIEPGKHVVVFSKEKFGKTTALVDFAGYLSREHGRVLIVQKEEELSGTFQDKFEQTRAANPNLDVIEEMPDDETLCGYKFIFLDSVTRLKISPDQLLDLQKRLAPAVFIAVLHATKDGQHRGANTYVQDASQIVEFPEFGAARGKGRFKGCTGELVRFAEPRK